MSQSTSIVQSSEVNLFQKHLYPCESTKVKWLMTKAAESGLHDNVLIRYSFPSLVVICAVALSALNALSYILQIPCKALLNVISYQPINFFVDISKGFADSLRSIAFVTLGISLAVAGFFIPGRVFPYFAPLLTQTTEERLKDQMTTLQGTLSAEAEEKAQLSEQLDTVRELYQKSEEQFQDSQNNLKVATKRVKELETQAAESSKRIQELEAPNRASGWRNLWRVL